MPNVGPPPKPLENPLENAFNDDFAYVVVNSTCCANAEIQ